VSSVPHVVWLRAFEAAARHNSFSAAADELNLTPAAVSQQVKLLEQHLEVQLFTRHARGVVLTDIGHSYAQPISRSFADMHEATNELFDPGHRREIRIHASISYAALVLAPQIARFNTLHPDIDVQLTTAVWTSPADVGAIDLEIRYGHGDWKEPDIRHLGHRHAHVVCHPQVAEALGQELTYSRLAEQAIKIMGSESDWRRMAEHFHLDLPQTRLATRVDSSLMALQLAAGGTGAALVADCFTGRYTEQGLLTSPFSYRLPLQRSFFLVVHEGAGSRREVVRFCDWLAGQHRHQT
jgi:LysR family glycine cleavage system transcriptional activator